MDTDYIPIAALNHYAYCPHRCWRMFCAGEFVDNTFTIEGTDLHHRVHTPAVEQGQWRAIWLRSERYRLIGKADLIEEQEGRLYPVEYKRGKRGEFDNDEVQVCAQALCLEEMTGRAIPEGFIYYTHSHQRQQVEMTQELRDQTIEIIAAVTLLLQTGQMPAAVEAPRCRGCSLEPRCLPRAVEKVKRYREV